MVMANSSSNNSIDRFKDKEPDMHGRKQAHVT